MDFFEWMSHATLKINTKGPSGNGSGTGVLIKFALDENIGIPMLVTNKHVVEGASEILVVFTLSGEDGKPNFGHKHEVVVQNAQEAFVLHPDADLAAIPIAHIIRMVEDSGVRLFYTIVDEILLGNDDIFSSLSPVQDVYMVGYPIGLYDVRNNLPLFRRGVTATIPKYDFNGKKEFVIDCACFPGSSGSPIIVNDDFFRSPDGGMAIGKRAYLIGILWGGPLHTAVGELIPLPIPLAQQGAVSKIPANLGYCIKATELLWFKEHFAKRAKQTPDDYAPNPIMSSPSPLQVDVGSSNRRNTLCHCGSGRRLKHCHGRFGSPEMERSDA